MSDDQECGGALRADKVAGDDQCHNCGKAGHWAKDCRQPKRGGQAHISEAKAESELTSIYFISALRNSIIILR